jgi:tetratricopeptide (TPR) repeat protein
LKLAQQLNDQSLLALAHAEKGSALALEEKFSEALDHLDQAYVIYNALGVQRSMGYNLLRRADVLCRLGRYAEAEGLLNQAAAIADRPGGELKELSAEIRLQWAQVSLSQNRYQEARERGEKLLASIGDQYQEMVFESKKLLALVEARNGSAARATQLANEALRMAEQSKNGLQLAFAKLTLAEVLLSNAQPQEALIAATEAKAVFAAGAEKESEWKASLLAAMASDQAGNPHQARELKAEAVAALAILEQRCGSQNFATYTARPDLQKLRQNLN